MRQGGVNFAFRERGWGRFDSGSQFNRLRDELRQFAEWGFLRITAEGYTEVAEAKASGLDGFTVDLLNLYGSTGNNAPQVARIMTAADQAGFNIVLMPDISALQSQTAATVAGTAFISTVLG